MTDARTVLCAGYMPMDIIDVGAGRYRRAGGTAANVAAILALLGWRAAVVGRIGDDRAGKAVLTDLKNSAVDTSLLTVEPGAATNRLVHEVRPGGHRYLFTCPRCEQALPRSRPLRLDQVDAVASASPQPDVYFFDRANPATVLLAERYAAAGVTVVFEPSTPANAALVQRAMGAASIVKGSHEHGPGLVESHRDGRPGQIRVITDGIRGAQVRLGSGTWRRAGAFPVEAVDAAGAGDWTTAGMLHTIIGRGEATLDDVARGITYGHALAALNCALPGARGLAEHRDVATIEQLAAEVQSGASVQIHNEPQPTQRVPSGVCSWCLLDTDRVADTTTPSARATVANR